uniref:Aryl hydrocarbon receptor 1b n=1 Tax=Sphaeramia orbicularis TaxID=375764 RepID=A0A673A840_9TELE
IYAGKSRKSMNLVKPSPPEGAKSNPSKRHRDRLNSELERLAGLLPFPEDVIASLDKLSILRLSVSYLRTKSFFSVALKDQVSSGSSDRCDHSEANRESHPVEGPISEGDLLLQVRAGHRPFPSVVLFQTDVMHQSVFELIHTEDQEEFRRNLHWALNPPTDQGTTSDPPTDGESLSTSTCFVNYNPEQLPPENSSFLERGFVCRFRCLLDNSSGFLALNIQGRLKFLHGQTRPESDNAECRTPPQLALFAIATPLQPPAILEIRTRNMIFRTKHKLDFTPMACDAKGKIVLGYTEAELRVRGSGYQFIHAADMLYCAENHVRMIKTGESGLTVFRLLTKDNRWKWVQANARLVYKNGKPDYIIATQRPLADEEGGEHLTKRSMHLPFTFATGEALLYQTSYPLHGFPDTFQGKAKGSRAKTGKLDKSSSDDLDPKSLLGALMSQDESVYVCQPDTEPKMPYHNDLFSEHQVVSNGFGDDSWHIVHNSEKPPSYDPLLATLDSLSLDGDDTCSNSELFNALENLGLNAEDLELLLLDERMIQVELDPNHVPSLSDLLSNNEILSYIHDSLEVDGQVDGHAFEALTHPENLDIGQSLTGGRQPIVQLSQQMQQHIGTTELLKAQPGQMSSHLGPVNTNVLPEVLNEAWAVPIENHHLPDGYNHQHPQTAIKMSQLNTEHKPLTSVVVSGQHQDHESTEVVLNDALIPSYHKGPGSLTNGAYIPNDHSGFSQNDYNMSSTAHVSGNIVNGDARVDVCHYQSLVATTQTSLLQEQFLALSQPQHNQSPTDAYNMMNTTTPNTHSKLENGCLLSTSNAAYFRTCLMPNGNGMVPGNIPVPCPEGLPPLQDPQKSGFFL